MLHRLGDLQGYAIHAVDDEIGKVHDIFFDDHRWTLRYAVIDTGWLFGRKVLISPEAFAELDPKSARLSLSLTKSEIEEGPGVDADPPVSRQEEIALRDHFGWSRYWEIYPAGTGAAPLVPPLKPQVAFQSSPARSAEAEVRERGDPHLRSAREVEGYRIEATDGEIGHVEDFVLDDDSWIVRYLVVDTRKWLPGRRVLVAPAWAEGVDWAGRLLRVNLDRDAIEGAPPYDATAPITRDFELRLARHFGREA